jgi:hypothetical protein
MHFFAQICASWEDDILTSFQFETASPIGRMSPNCSLQDPLLSSMTHARPTGGALNAVIIHASLHPNHHPCQFVWTFPLELFRIPHQHDGDLSSKVAAKAT